MPINRTSVDSYLQDGCGRCEHYQTPQCKVNLWPRELVMLREMLLASGLEETMKWGSPTYTLKGRNVVMLISQRQSCALQFSKGAILADPTGALESPGPNSHYVRLLRFRSPEEVVARRELANALIGQAIALEEAGVEIEPDRTQETLPDELARRLAADAALQAAFSALTPGRQRSHILHVGGAKQAETRERRVDRCIPEILAGRGFNERY